MKDNFDLRAYLTENKMTENSRGDGRRHFDGKNLVVESKRRNLAELEMPAYPDRAEAEDESWYRDSKEFFDECDMNLNEAGYTDDDDFDDDDFGLGAALAADKNADRAAAAAKKDIDKGIKADEKDDAALAAADAADAAPGDDDDAEGAPEAGELPTDDTSVEDSGSLEYANQVKYNPDLVELEMTPEELNAYLGHFRRPQVATNYLNRCLRSAQREVNDSIGLNHLFLILDRGLYRTSRRRDGIIIATIKADKAYREKEYNS